MEVMKLYDYFRSSAAYRVRIALNLKGLAPEREFVHLRRNAQRSDDYLAVNPLGLVPVLVTDEGQVLSQSLAIVEYLDERYPHPPLMPQDPAGRARVRMSAQRIEQELFPLAAALAGTGGEATAARKQLVDGLKAGARFFPARGHMLGPEYSLADTAWTVLLRRVQAAGLALPPEAASVTAYAARMFARPGFQRCFHPAAAAPASASRRRV